MFKIDHRVIGVFCIEVRRDFYRTKKDVNLSRSSPSGSESNTFLRFINPDLAAVCECEVTEMTHT